MSDEEDFTTYTYTKMMQIAEPPPSTATMIRHVERLQTEIMRKMFEQSFLSPGALMPYTIKSPFVRGPSYITYYTCVDCRKQFADWDSRVTNPKTACCDKCEQEQKEAAGLK